MTDDRQLIDACNLLCEYVSENLPKGWEITLEMRKDEASIELTDPFGERREGEAADYGVSTIRDMCESANELDKTLDFSDRA